MVQQSINMTRQELKQMWFNLPTSKVVSKTILVKMDKYKDRLDEIVNAMNKIKDLALDKILNEVVLEDKKPILGICLGMQLLCNYSEEDGGAQGLGYVDAECRKFSKENLKVPHVGFNQVILNSNTKLYDGFNKDSDFYFVHSYRLQSDRDINQSHCNYQEDFIASFEQSNIVGTQFHPELSQTNGLKILKNLSALLQFFYMIIIK